MEFFCLSSTPIKKIGVLSQTCEAREIWPMSPSNDFDDYMRHGPSSWGEEIILGLRPLHDVQNIRVESLFCEVKRILGYEPNPKSAEDFQLATHVAFWALRWTRLIPFALWNSAALACIVQQYCTMWPEENSGRWTIKYLKNRGLKNSSKIELI